MNECNTLPIPSSRCPKVGLSLGIFASGNDPNSVAMWAAACTLASREPRGSGNYCSSSWHIAEVLANNDTSLSSLPFHSRRPVLGRLPIESGKKNVRGDLDGSIAVPANCICLEMLQGLDTFLAGRTYR